jgi:hypothetical protein
LDNKNGFLRIENAGFSGYGGFSQKLFLERKKLIDIGF